MSALGAREWLRVLLCGLVAGGVWTLLSVILLAALGGEFLAALRRLGPASPSGGVPFTLLANFGAGIWAMWLYAAIRTRFGPGPWTALRAGCAWWFLQTLQSAKWLSLVDVRAGAGVLAAATLPAMIVAVLAGAWAYDR